MAKETTLKLDVKDRLVLPSLLAKEGGILELTLARDIRKKTDLGQDDFEKFGITQVGNGYKWDDDEPNGTEMIFTSAEIQYLKGQVDLMDKQKKLNTELLELCLKIKDLT